MYTHHKNHRRIRISRIILLLSGFICVITFIYYLSQYFYQMLVTQQNSYVSTNVADTSDVPNCQPDPMYNDDPLYAQLCHMVSQDERIQDILDHYDAYPHTLLEKLIQDIDVLTFVYDYPQRKDFITPLHIPEVQEGEIPLLLQWDQRWGYQTYGDDIMAITGCAPTALSMVIIGLTQDTSITPYVLANDAQENGYYVAGVGTSWSMLTQGVVSYGIEGVELPLSEQNIVHTLQNGKPIICSMRPGDFTETGHFIVLTDIEKGKIRIHDPNSKKRSDRLWNYDTLEYQIENLWFYDTI